MTSASKELGTLFDYHEDNYARAMTAMEASLSRHLWITNDASPEGLPIGRPRTSFCPYPQKLNAIAGMHETGYSEAVTARDEQTTFSG